MSREIPPYGLRMPPELRATLEKSAERNGRSLNAEIVAVLQAHVEKRPEKPPLPVTAEQEPSPYLSDLDEMALRVFRALPVEKQLALLSLFK